MENIEKSDSELIAEVKMGNLQAFDSLMQRYQKFVYSIAFGFGKSKDNALDITQNVFLKLYQNLHSFREQSLFKTWLTRICYNESINWSKRNKRHMDRESLEMVSNFSSNNRLQEDELLAKENKVLLLQSLFGLNTRYRLAVILRYFEEKSITEIAAVLNCSEGVVKNMLFRSLQKLKKNLIVSH